MSADVQPVLFSTSSIHILSSIVTISFSLKRHPPRPRSPPRSPPLRLRTAKTTQRAVSGNKQIVQTHSGRVERHAAWGEAQSERRAIAQQRATGEKRIELWGAEKHQASSVRASKGQAALPAPSHDRLAQHRARSYHTRPSAGQQQPPPQSFDWRQIYLQRQQTLPPPRCRSTPNLPP